jgi:eukaryotic-like serine/threonine-protein kinase
MAVPERIGRYTLLGRLSTGGMAEIFLARQEGPQRFSKVVVVKRILPHLAEDRRFVEMFLDEARLAALINHPNVVSILELGEDAGSYFIAMEHVDGSDLRQIQRAARLRNRALPWKLYARIVADACAGLDFAHNFHNNDKLPLNLVHRDVSPDNILVSYTGVVKVVDFGIAKARDTEGRTKAGQVKGKFAYMSPEQLLGKPLDRRTDVWALGVVLHWLCSGALPFDAENEAALIREILEAPVPPLGSKARGVPAALEAFAMRALARDLSARYPHARAMQQDLEQWMAQPGQAFTNAALADVMNELFPESTDEHRLFKQSLLRGDAHPIKPSSDSAPTRALPPEELSPKPAAPARKPTTPPRPEAGKEPPMTQGSLFEALFAKSLKPTGAFLEELKRSGYDPERPQPKYPAVVWQHSLQVALRHAYADKDPHQGMRLLGRRLLASFLDHTLIGKALGVGIALIAPEDVIRRFPKYISTSREGVATSVAQEGPHRFRISVADPYANPDLVCGLIEEVTTRKKVVANVEVDKVIAYNFEIVVAW